MANQNSIRFCVYYYTLIYFVSVNNVEPGFQVITDLEHAN